jgi:hypothetical protein
VVAVGVGHVALYPSARWPPPARMCLIQWRNI